ncbi:hypothetical protein BC332_01160 [Capsicum chinense]|nr:hypothetical protein BC332_01160 [Capsicum chinense]
MLRGTLCFLVGRGRRNAISSRTEASPTLVYLTAEVSRLAYAISRKLYYEENPVNPSHLAFMCICKGIQAVGRAVDLTRLDGYGDLLMKLDMFEIEGELRGSTKKWLVVYTNDEDDMIMVGDDLW